MIHTDDLSREIERCEQMLQRYAECGPGGQYAELMLARSLVLARTAKHDGSAASMLRSLQDLRGYAE